MRALCLFEQRDFLDKVPRFCFTQIYELLENIGNILHDSCLCNSVMHSYLYAAWHMNRLSPIPKPDVLTD